MAKTNLQDYLNEVKKKFDVDYIFHRITTEEINYNLEMMPTKDADVAEMFLAGTITRLDLIDVLLGKKELPFRKA